MPKTVQTMEPVEIFNEEKFNDFLSSFAPKMHWANEVLRTYDALNLGSINAEELTQLINRPESFVREKIVDKEIVKLNGVNFDRALFAQLVAVPDLTGLKAACNRSKEEGFNSNIFTIEGGKATVKAEIIDRTRKAATYRFTNEKQIRIYELIKIICDAGNEVREICDCHSEQSAGKRPLDMLIGNGRLGKGGSFSYEPDLVAISKME